MITINKNHNIFTLIGMANGSLELVSNMFSHNPQNSIFILRCTDHDIQGLQGNLSNLPLDNKIFELSLNKYYDLHIPIFPNTQSFPKNDSFVQGTNLKFIQGFKKFQFFSENHNPLFLYSVDFMKLPNDDTNICEIILFENMPNPLKYRLRIPIGDCRE